MLSVPMAYNVISCTKIPKEHSNNQNRQFYYVNLAPELRNDENLPKNGSLNRNLLNFLNRYGIFKMLPGESSCLDGSEYVWQRGVESLQGRDTAAQVRKKYL